MMWTPSITDRVARSHSATTNESQDDFGKGGMWITSSFRGTGITAYLKGDTLEKARQMAAHASTRTTQLDRRADRVTPPP
jgi:hypothetical protein